MSVALLSSYRSKDKKTQNGACIVGNHHRIIGMGYNGLPRGCDDCDPIYWADESDEDPLYSKHTYVVHAEKNAIYNSIHRDLEGATMYATQYPCNVCAQAIIQVGINTVIYMRKKHHHNDLNLAVEKMFNDARVEVIQYHDLTQDDSWFIDHLIHAGDGYNAGHD